MDIALLGPGCPNCQTLEHHTRQAVAELGLTADIVKVTDYAEIAAYGIMSTPGLVVDGEVVMSGRVPTVREVKELLAAYAD